MATTTLLDRPRKLTALRALYVYTIVSAGPIGLWMLLAPSSFAASFGIPAGDPYLVGILGAVYTAFVISAALGLRAPVRFAPVFLFQLFYKALWLVILFAPRALHGGVPGHAWIVAVVFASFVIFDLLALPFSTMFS